MWKIAVPHPKLFVSAEVPPHAGRPLGGAARGRCAPSGRRPVSPTASLPLLRPRGGVGAKIKPSRVRSALTSGAGPATRRRAPCAMVRAGAALLGPRSPLSLCLPQSPGCRDPGPGGLRGRVLRPWASNGGAATSAPWPPALSGLDGAALSPSPTAQPRDPRPSPRGGGDAPSSPPFCAGSGRVRFAAGSVTRASAPPSGPETGSLSGTRAPAAERGRRERGALFAGKGGVARPRAGRPPGAPGARLIFDH